MKGIKNDSSVADDVRKNGTAARIAVAAVTLTSHPRAKRDRNRRRQRRGHRSDPTRLEGSLELKLERER